MSRSKTNELIKKDVDNTLKARDARDYDAMLLDFIEKEIKGESK